MIKAGSMWEDERFLAIQSVFPNRTASNLYNAIPRSIIIRVQGENKGPSTAARLTIAINSTRLCSHTLGKKYQARSTAKDTITAAYMGNQEMVKMKPAQAKSKPDKILNSKRRYESGTRNRINPNITIAIVK